MARRRRVTTVETSTKLRCSFCGKSQDDVAKLVAGPGVYICDACIGLCAEIIEQNPKSPTFFAALDDKSDDELIEMMVSFHASHQGIDDSTHIVVHALRDRGVSWTRVGEALNMTR